MYVTVLSRALERWDAELDDDELIDYARQCRASLPQHDIRKGAVSASALAAEIAYDRALVCLAAQLGIGVATTNYDHPRIERERIEVEMRRRGIDLAVGASIRDKPKDVTESNDP